LEEAVDLSYDRLLMNETFNIYASVSSIYLNSFIITGLSKWRSVKTFLCDVFQLFMSLTTKHFKVFSVSFKILRR
jgi:hypothetical protein